MERTAYETGYQPKPPMETEIFIDGARERAGFYAHFRIVKIPVSGKNAFVFPKTELRLALSQSVCYSVSGVLNRTLGAAQEAAVGHIIPERG
jgi:hypothetical protein